MRPAISVVMPVRNQSHLIGNAISSILSQTFENWQLVIVDDCSDMAHSRAMEQQIERINDPRITALRLGTHQGLVEARNFGTNIASAPLIAHQDADDLSLPDRLDRIVKEFELSGADVVVHGIYANWWDAHWKWIHREYKPAPPLNVKLLIEEQYLPGVCGFRKKLWSEKPFRMETQFAYDWMMHLDWALSGAKYSCLDIGLYEYVRQENSASQQFLRDGRKAESVAKIKEILRKEYAV